MQFIVHKCSIIVPFDFVSTHLNDPENPHTYIWYGTSSRFEAIFGPFIDQEKGWIKLIKTGNLSTTPLVYR